MMDDQQAYVVLVAECLELRYNLIVIGVAELFHKVFAVDPSCDGHIPFFCQFPVELLHDLVGVGDRYAQLLCHIIDFHKAVLVQ